MYAKPMNNKPIIRTGAFTNAEYLQIKEDCERVISFNRTIQDSLDALEVITERAKVISKSMKETREELA